MRYTLITAFLCIFLMSSLSVARAEIYKYTDERGVIHFTDTPTNPRYRPVSSKRNSAGDERRYDHIIRMLCREHQMDFSLVKAVIKAESAFNPQAISKKGARGLMQLMPDTARELSVDDPFDPYDNLQGGVRYLRQMLNIFNGDVTLAVAAYNAGPGAVQSSNAVPPYPETRMYVKRVLQYRREYLSMR
jgi:soluble lytic murein transglycosylase-like protein